MYIQAMAPDPPPPRGGKRERTKAALIEAFWGVVDEQGLAAATLEAVAQRAGMSRGAIYSNFASRAELLIAAASVRGLRIDRSLEGPGSLGEQLQRYAKGLAQVLPTAPGTQLWHAELLLHIAKDPGLKAFVAAGVGAGFRAMAAQLEAQHGDRLAMPAASLALAIESLTMGLVYQAILSPESVSEQMVLDAFAALARGAVR